MEYKISDLILVNNNQLLAFNKPNTLPIQNDLSGEKSLHSLAEIYSKSKMFVVNRLDRPASGAVVFAKNAKAVTHLNQQFQNRTVHKTYLAVVGQLPAKKEDTLVHYLKKNSRAKRSDVVQESEKGAKRAELSYKVIKSIENYHLLEIQLKTGRFHQIRAQLGAIGSPIKGDNKYGFKRSNRDRSIHLHAWKLTIEHPVSGDPIAITAPLPDEVVWNAFEWPENN